MHSLLFQDIVTVYGTTTTTSVAQSDAEALDLAAYQDFSASIEVMALAAGGAPSPKLWLETAPLKEEALFASPQDGLQTNVPLVVGLTTTRNILNAPLRDTTAQQIPLARWLRWRLDLASASSSWSVTFRIHLAAHSVWLPRAS